MKPKDVKNDNIDEYMLSILMNIYKEYILMNIIKKVLHLM